MILCPAIACPRTLLPLTLGGPALPQGHPAYPPFVPMAQDGQNIDRVLGEMADQGLKGQVYSREEVMEKYLSGGGGPMDGSGGPHDEL